ncbi:MAG: hypothetical protein IPI67_27810 [Myxococcales bacterium]|nr:hypothetical protein [Myxococcales bacterium]
MRRRSVIGWLAGCSTVAAVCFCTSAAHADGGPKIRDSLWLPLGLNFGYSLNPDPVSNGFLVGPEASFVYLDHSTGWAGAYTDVLRDFGSDTTRLGVGAEAGMAIFGVDLGYERSFGDTNHHGIRGRFLLSFAAVHFYGGVGRVFADAGGFTYGEVGVLLKFPIMMWEKEGFDHGRYPRPDPAWSDPGYAPPGQQPQQPQQWQQPPAYAPTQQEPGYAQPPPR